MRPMSEAPLNEPILLIYTDGSHRHTTLHGPVIFAQWGLVKGFYTFPDLLRAAEIVAAIAPEGMAYFEHDTERVSQDRSVASRMIYFRRIDPPVEYRYEAEDSKRVPTNDDYVWSGLRWIDYETWLRECVRPCKLDQDTATALCARRVEVKR